MTIAIRSGGARDHETRHQTHAMTPVAKDPTWVREVVDGREAKRPRIDGKPSKTTARAQELRVAAFLVRDEAVAVGREERETRKEKVTENLFLQAQG